MNRMERKAEQFEEHRHHLQAVAYRMLGSLSDAEDAVQETWVRLSRSDTSDVVNLGGWLTTVVSRVSLDMLRSRKSRREDSTETHMPETFATHSDRNDPEHEALLADSVGLALLVVLDHLNPAERIAFVLRDIFAVPFNEIAPILGKSETAVRQLASRARRRVQGAGKTDDAEIARQRELVDAFLAASRVGDFDALVAALDPDVVVRDDRRTGGSNVTRGAKALAMHISGRAQAAQSALVNGRVGAIVAPRGKLLYILQFTLIHGKIVEVDLVSEPARMRQMDLAVLDV